MAVVHADFIYIRIVVSEYSCSEFRIVITIEILQRRERHEVQGDELISVVTHCEFGERCRSVGDVKLMAVELVALQIERLQRCHART